MILGRFKVHRSLLHNRKPNLNRKLKFKIFMNEMQNSTFKPRVPLPAPKP